MMRRSSSLASSFPSLSGFTVLVAFIVGAPTVLRRATVGLGDRMVQLEHPQGMSSALMTCSKCAAQWSRASRFSRSNEYFT